MSFIFALASIASWMTGIGCFENKLEGHGMAMTFLAILIAYCAGLAS